MHKHICTTASVYTFKVVELIKAFELYIFLHNRVEYAQTHLLSILFTVFLVDQLLPFFSTSFLVLSLIEYYLLFERRISWKQS